MASLDMHVCVNIISGGFRGVLPRPPPPPSPPFLPICFECKTLAKKPRYFDNFIVALLPTPHPLFLKAVSATDT